MFRPMLVATTLFLALGAAAEAENRLVAPAAAGERMVVRGRAPDAASRVQGGAHAVRVPRGDGEAVVDIFFGIGPRIGDPAATGAAGFVAAAGRAPPAVPEGITIARGARPAADPCSADPAASAGLAEDGVPAPLPVSLR